MLGRLVVKILFKVCMVLVMVSGAMSYAVHLQGGDPAALWRRVASGAFGHAADMFLQAKNDAFRLAGDLTAEGQNVEIFKRSSGLTELFTWKDASGVTHFGSETPEGVSATLVAVNPDVNVLAPVKTMNSRTQTSKDDALLLDSERSSIGRADAIADDGYNASSGSKELDQSVKSLDPSRLIRLLQSAD